MQDLEMDADGKSGINFNIPREVPSSSPNKGEKLLSMGGIKGGCILLEALTGRNPYRKYIRIPMPDDDFDVAFYPEGGSLIQGMECQVAFKAMKSDGQAAHISGMIYDRDGNEIRPIESEHLGMGRFLHQAEKGKTYYAVCENEKGQTKRFDLPAAVDQGAALAVNVVDDKIEVKG
jgi:hypothetical protein